MRGGKGRAGLTPRQVIVPLGIAAALFLGVLAAEGGFGAESAEAFWRALCDALTVPGVLLGGAGLLAVVSDHGAFHGLSFGVRKAVGQLRSEEKRARMPRTYYDFVQQQRSKPHRSPRMLLITGGACLGLAGAVLIYYLNAF